MYNINIRQSVYCIMCSPPIGDKIFFNKYCVKKRDHIPRLNFIITCLENFNYAFLWKHY